MKIKLILISSLLCFVCLLSCSKNKHEQGEGMYNHYCGSCHGLNGLGLGELTPPIANSSYYRENYSSVPTIIKYGIKDTIEVNGIAYAQPMQGLSRLTNTEIANIINYMNARWYSDYPFLSPKEVGEKLIGEYDN